MEHGVIKMEIDAGAMEELSNLLSSAPDTAKEAIALALKRARDTVQAESVRVVTGEYAISAKNLREEQNVKSRDLSGKSEFSALLSFSGARIPLTRFDFNPKTGFYDKAKTVEFYEKRRVWRVHPGRPVSVRVKKESAKERFQAAFVAKFKSGHVGIVQRLGKTRLHIGGEKEKEFEFLGPSVSQMLDNEGVKDDLTKVAQETFNKRVLHELERLRG